MKAVLDTNVWLDCLVFDDPGVVGLKESLRSGQLVVLRTDEMRDEWLDVIARDRFGLDESSRRNAAFAFERLSVPCARAPSCRLLCRDATDRKFVDLAVAEKAAWLLTKDRALLALARPARRDHSLTIARPDAPTLLAALSGLPAPRGLSL